MKSILLSFFIGLIGFASHAANCISEADRDSFLQSYSIQTFDDVKGKWIKNYAFPLCDDDNFINKLARGFVFLKNVQINSRVADSTSIVSREGAESYFKKRISSLLVETRNHDIVCFDKRVVAFVRPRQGPYMHLCPDGFHRYSSPLMISYIMLHEARHMDGFSHVFCKQGPLKEFNAKSDSGACDESYELQGSYGVGTGYLLEVYRNAADPVIKQEARSNTVIDLLQRFNRLPLSMKAGVLVQNDQSEITFYDGINKTPILTMPEAIQAANLRTGIPTFFLIDGSVKSYLFSKSLVDGDGSFAQAYRNKFSGASRAETMDVFYDHEYACFLMKKKIVCGPNNKKVVINFVNIKPIQFLRTSKSALVKNNIIYIAAADGYLYALPETLNELVKIKDENQLKRSSRPFNLLSLAPGFNHDELAITFDGSLLSYSDKTNNWKPVNAYKDANNIKILSPFTWSKKLEDL